MIDKKIHLLCSTILLVVISLSASCYANSSSKTWRSKSFTGQWKFGAEHINKKDWKIISTNRSDWNEAFASAHILDDDLDTYWYQHALLEHEVIIDMGQTYSIAGISLLTVDRVSDSIKKCKLSVSTKPQIKNKTLIDLKLISKGKEKIATFAPLKGRYLTLRFPVDTVKSRVCLSELNVVSTEAVNAIAQQSSRLEAEQINKEKARKKKWAERSSTQAIETLAKNFMNLLALEDVKKYHTALMKRKKINEIIVLNSKGENTQALNIFRDYFLNKLRFPNKYGISNHDVNPYTKGICGLGRWQATLDPNADSEKVISSADRLLKGEMHLGKKWQQIGEPGEVDWMNPIKESELWDRTKLAYRELSSAQGFNPLVHAYFLTQNIKYLIRWIEYMDDWAMNSDYTESIHPSFVPHGSRPNPLPIIRLIGGIAASSADDNLFPATSLARILKRCLRISLLNVFYLRSNSHNWTPNPVLMNFALLLDEFKAAPVLFRECRRRNLEDNSATQNLRDGTENQQCPWYNDNYLQVSTALRMLDARQNMPMWMEMPWSRELRKDLSWRQEMQEHLTARVNYYLRLRTPQNEWPIGVRGGDKRKATGTDGEFMYGSLYSIAQEAYRDPENKKIVSNIHNPEAGIRPSYTSEWFPYAGYNLVREGWERDSGYGFLFCSPHAGSYGGFRSRSNNNSFGLGFKGQDLLVSDCVGHYMYPLSPITVDGKNQFFHAGYYKVPPPANHKSWLISAWTEPSPWRWHSSDNFNLMEGIYDGAWDNSYTTKALASCLQGIEHQRLVHYVREANVWIITDRMTTGSTEREYDQVWRLPLKPSAYNAFLEKDIVVNPKTKSIKTHSMAMSKIRGIEHPQANISLHQFSRNELVYSDKLIPKTKNHYQAYGRKDIHVKWKSAGASQIITVVYPREKDSIDLLKLEKIKGQGDTYGFSCDTPNGTHIEYLASAGKYATLKLGSIKVVGESLLITQNKHSNKINGIVLGATSYSNNGKEIKLTHPDFEIKEQTPIYRPISPVTINPKRNIFVDKLEITMKSTTPDVKIHYTLDGTKPTPQSSRYEGPLKIMTSAVVKAIAYRPSVTQNPVQLSGTHATVVTRAVYDKVQNQPALNMQRTKSGLSYKYYEGDWKDLYLFRYTLKPKKEGTTSGIFDLSILPADNPPVTDAAAPRQKFFAVEYEGYLEIPEDGVYTFHAPREMVYPDTDAGYDLQIFLGRNEIPWGYRTKLIGNKEWYPATRLHSLGNWSLALKKGIHPFRVAYMDFRTTAPTELNIKDCRDYVWSGVTPDLKISGPNLEKQSIPLNWFKY